MAKSIHANKGKWAEKQMANFLVKVNDSRYDFAFHRLPDARAARGALAAQPADFMASVAAQGDWEKQFYFIEVKEVKHDYRIPFDKVSQWAVLNQWSNSGANAFVAVYHSTLNKWRLVFIDELTELRETSKASWDLRDYKLYASVEEACKARMVFSGPI
jgi:hypothetical protein